jgi:hypothetical protein
VAPFNKLLCISDSRDMLTPSHAMARHKAGAPSSIDITHSSWHNSALATGAEHSCRLCVLAYRLGRR